jgi:hypothetical protein
LYPSSVAKFKSSMQRNPVPIQSNEQNRIIQQNLGFANFGNVNKNEQINVLNKKKVNFTFGNGASDPIIVSSKKVSPILI